ncbi:MAG: protein kinase [Sandaracinaceae bacterium]
MSTLEDRRIASRFVLHEAIGRGAAATVYRATNEATQGAIAVKVLHAHHDEGSDFAARFEREARAAAALSHPNSARVLDYGVDGDVRYIAMELVEGERLKDILGGEPLGWRRAVTIGVQILRALADAHRSGIVHRDVKPANVMVMERDFVKVVDFGVASLVDEATRTVQPIGTPSYMAPELWRGEPFDLRADLYSFGCVMYEMLTGAPPFSADTVPRLGMLHTYQRVPTMPKSVPNAVAAMTYRLLEKSADARPSSATSVADALEAMLETPRTELDELPAEPAAVELPRARPSRATLAGLALLAVGALGTVGWLVASGPRDTTSTDRVAEPSEEAAPIPTPSFGANLPRDAGDDAAPVTAAVEAPTGADGGPPAEAETAPTHRPRSGARRRTREPPPSADETRDEGPPEVDPLELHPW